MGEKQSKSLVCGPWCDACVANRVRCWCVNEVGMHGGEAFRVRVGDACVYHLDRQLLLDLSADDRVVQL